MGSIALDWYKEIKPMHEAIKNMQSNRGKKISTSIQCKSSE